MLERLSELPAFAPNSMNQYGRVVTGPLMIFMRRLQEQFCTPIARDVFRFGVLSKRPYAFSVDYAASGGQRGLNKHYDEGSAITLNVCLGYEGFRGGELSFYDERGKIEYVHRHKIGWGLVHRGSHIHKAHSLDEGKRAGLILWCATRFERELERELEKTRRRRDSTSTS